MKDDYGAKEDKVKVPFWPSTYQVIGGLGFLIGAVGGPVVLYLGIWVLNWFIPIGYGLFFFVILFGLSVPLGAAAGLAIGMAIAERKKC